MESVLPFRGMHAPTSTQFYTISVVSCASLSKSWCPQTNCLLYSLKKARQDPLFDNVLRRKEHCHGRCTGCAMFTARFARGFLSTAEMEEWEAKRAAHRKQYTSSLRLDTTEPYLAVVCRRYRDWRKKEEILMALARDHPHKYTVIRLDDTEAVSLPHPGNRIPKNLHGKNGPEVSGRCLARTVMLWRMGVVNHCRLFRH